MSFFFFFNDTATTEIYTVMNTLSLHDALPIWRQAAVARAQGKAVRLPHGCDARSEEHTSELQSLITISYAVFCLKKKNNTYHHVLHIISTKEMFNFNLLQHY